MGFAINLLNSSYQTLAIDIPVTHYRVRNSPSNNYTLVRRARNLRKPGAYEPIHHIFVWIVDRLSSALECLLKMLTVEATEKERSICVKIKGTATVISAGIRNNVYQRAQNF